MVYVIKELRKIEEDRMSGWTGAGELVLIIWGSVSVLCHKQRLGVIDQRSLIEVKVFDQ